MKKQQKMEKNWNFSLEDVEEWDTATINQLIQTEAEITGSKGFSQAVQISHGVRPNFDDGLSGFSPPRELSQRVWDNGRDFFAEKKLDFVRHSRNDVSGRDFIAEKKFDFVPHSGNGVCIHGEGSTVSADLGCGGNEKEIQVLKKELERLSNQLVDRDRECLELKKDRDKKDEQLKCALSQIEAKDVEVQCLKGTHVQSSMQNPPNTSLRSHRQGNFLDQDESEYPISDIKGTSSTPWTRKRTSKRLSRNSSSSLIEVGEPSLDYQRVESYGSSRKKVPANGLSAVSDLKRRLLIDTASRPWTPNECSIQEEEIVCLGTRVQSKWTKTIGIQTDPLEDNGHSSTKDQSWKKTIGIQTDPSEDHGHSSAKDQSSAEHDLLKKLTGIWQSSRDKISGRNLVSKLFVTCAEDLHVLFRCMSMSHNPLGSLAEKSLSDVTLHDHMQSIQSVEAVKVGRLYLILTKMVNEMAQIDALLQALFDLCILENVDIVHRSLRIVHVVLHHLLSFGTRSGRRDNVMVVNSRNQKSHEDKKNTLLDNKILECQEYEKQPEGSRLAMVWDETSFLGLFASSAKSCNAETLCKKELENFGIANSLINWIELFEKTQRIALENANPCIQEQAISIMNLIIMRSNPNAEREKFGTVRLFESVSQLLCEKVGVFVRLQAVHLLFLLLNCPKILKLFYIGCKDGVECAATVCSKDNAELHGRCRSILEGLGECVACIGDNIEERILGRHAIHVLAFIATSDKSGIEVLLNPGTSKRINFLELLVKVLCSELDAEEAALAKSKVVASEGICKESTSLVREALILLCRLVSNSDYSCAVLEGLTSSRATRRLTVDVTNRIVGKRKWYQNADATKKMHANQADIGELARVFRARILPRS